MDVLEQFLNSIAYKFPKGYPDINDKQDMLLLENELKKLGIDLNELINTDHYNDRKKERGNILDIVNLGNKILGDKYQSKDIKPEIIDNIEAELNKRLSYLEAMNSIPISFNKEVAYKILKPVLKVNNTKHDLILKTEYDSSGTSKSNEGNFYLAVITNNKIKTLLLLEPKSDADIESQLQAHMERIGDSIKPITILSFDNFEYIISLDESSDKTEKELIDPQTLPYKIKTSYRPGSNFTHDKFGIGTIVAAASSGTRSGEPDSRGMVDWIEVKYDRPYLSGGQLKNTRKFEKIYTLLAPDLDIKTTE